MTLHNLGAHRSQVNGPAGHELSVRALKRKLAQDAVAQARGTDEPYNDRPRCGPPSGNSTDGETFGIRALGKWQRSHKGLDPASAAILGYLIEVATKGIATVKQRTIADRTGLSVSTVGRRLDLLEHVGLISREKRTGKHNHRLCDAISLELACRPVKLTRARSMELMRQFNGSPRDGGESKFQGDGREADRKICGVEEASVTGGRPITVKEPLSHDVSNLSPVQHSSTTSQNAVAVSAERGCDASASPPIAPAGDQRDSSEESRPSTDQGSASAQRPNLDDVDIVAPWELDPELGDGNSATAEDSDIDAADEMYRDPATKAGDGDGEYASGRGADSAGHEPPVGRPAPAPASTPPAPAARPAKLVVIKAELPWHQRPLAERLDEKGVPQLQHGGIDFKAVCWEVLLFKLQALYKKNTGGFMTQRIARGRLAKIIKSKGGEKEAAIFIREILDIGPSGNPFDYAQKVLLGEQVDLITARDRLAEPVRYI